MLVLRYTKTNGAEFISHLDTLRHLCRTTKRAKINVKMSEGYNPHMRINMSAPLPVGLKSLSEYVTIETDEEATGIIEKFNKYSIKGMKCLEAYSVEKNPNVAGIIDSATYKIEGISNFDVDEILNRKEYFVKDKKKGEIEVRERIKNLYFEDDLLFVTLSFGNFNLRIDTFCDSLKENDIVSETDIDYTKIEVYSNNKMLDDKFFS